jgi:hypothetical protein
MDIRPGQQAFSIRSISENIPGVEDYQESFGMTVQAALSYSLYSM